MVRLLQRRKKEVSQIEGAKVVDCLGGLQASHRRVTNMCGQASVTSQSELATLQ